jgi:DNA-binding transcriptional LysR family regulator
MEIRQLRYAIRLAETLHFGKAASIENIAQSAFSAHLARLERELGVRLFDRSSHHVALTVAGAAFVEKVAHILAQLSDASDTARALDSGQEHVMRLGIFADAAGELVPAILAIYRRMRPDVRIEFVELSMVDQLDKLLAEKIDVAVVYAPFVDDRIVTLPVYTEPRVAVLPSRHPLAEATEIAVDDLLDEPFAAADARAPTGWAAYWTCDDQRGEPGRVATTVTSAREGLMASALLGAVDTVPMTFARNSPYRGVVYMPIVDASPSTVTVAFRRNDKRPHVHAFDAAVQCAVQMHIDLVPGAARAEL